LFRFFPDALHFTITEQLKKEYEDIKGYLLEFYLSQLLKNRMTELVVIPEGSWKEKKGENKGSDFIIIDHGINPCVIGIEIKSRRMKPATRFLLSDNDLIENYKDLWDAIKKMPEKLVKAFSLVGDYQKYEDDLKKAFDYPRFYLGIAGETPYLFGELALYLSKKNTEHLLNDFTEPWAVMSTETFENFIEILFHNNRAIADVLNEYMEDCADLEISTPMAEIFRNSTIDYRETFAFNLCMKHLKTSVKNFLISANIKLGEDILNILK